MAAATTDRNTARKYVERAIDPQPQKGSTTIYAGTLVGRASADNYHRPALDSSGFVVTGVSGKRSANAGADGASSTGMLLRGVFKLANAASNGCDRVGETAYVVDDSTVGKAAATTNSVVAGVVDGIDADGGVWVAVGL
jgi:hypothetical protein